MAARRLIRYLLSFAPRPMFLAFAAGILSGLIHTGLLMVINRGLAGPIDEGIDPRWQFLGLCALFPLARIGAQVLMVSIGERAIFELRMSLCRRILALPLRHLEEMGAGKLLATLTTDVFRISNATAALPVLLMHLSIFVSCLAYLMYLDLYAGIGVCTALAVGALLYRILGQAGSSYLDRSRAENDFLLKHFHAVAEGAKELKQHRARRRNFTEALLGFSASSYRRHTVTGIALFVTGGTLSQLLYFLAIGFAVFLLPTWGAAPTSELVTGYTLVLLYLLYPLDGITLVLPDLAQASISFARVESLGIRLDEAPSEPLSEPSRFAPSWHSVRYADLTFTYPPSGDDPPFRLGPIDFSLRPGELTFVIGGNGTGKTTFAKLLLGLYAPDGGEIIWDGAVVTAERRDAFRQLFSAIHADFFLFEQLQGLKLAKNEDLIREFLAQLDLHHKITIEDQRFSTVDLSSGQRKRLALLTSFLEDRPIYLFDEWAADQDPVFRQLFYRSILPQLKSRGKTVVVITHDEHYFDVADRLIRLETRPWGTGHTVVLRELPHPRRDRIEPVGPRSYRIYTKL